MSVGAFVAATESARRQNNQGTNRMREQQNTGSREMYRESNMREGRRNAGNWYPGEWQEEYNNRMEPNRRGVYRGEKREGRENRRQERRNNYENEEREEWDDWEDDDDEDDDNEKWEKEGREKQKYEITKEKAIKWVESMENEDPAHPHGARWTMEEVKPLAAKHGIKENTTEFVEFWATMNMLYSDYYNVFKEYNLTTGDAFAKMAKAFLHDKDAMDHKLGRYYCSVVKK